MAEEKKIGFFDKAKLVTLGIKLAKQFPKLAITAAICGVLYYGYMFMDNMNNQTKALQAQVVELKQQNQAILDANQEIAASNKAIKEGMETYQQRLIEIRDQTNKLQESFTNEKFRELLKSNLPKAEKELNDFFNKYMKGFQTDTEKYAK